MDIENIQESINTIMSTNLSDEKKNNLVEELLSSTIKNGPAKARLSKGIWTDRDTKYVYSTAVKCYGPVETWEYGEQSKPAFVRTLDEMSEHTGRTALGVKAHINNVCSTNNLTINKKHTSSIKRLMHYKQIALSVGLINQATYIETLNNGLKQGTLTVAEVQTYLDTSTSVQSVEPVETITIPSAPIKPMVTIIPRAPRFNVPRASATATAPKRRYVHYTHEERVDIFGRIKEKLGTYDELCEVYNCNVLSLGAVPGEIWKAMKDVATEMDNNRSGSAIKGQLNCITSHILNPSAKLTKGKIATIDAAVEAGFIEGVTA
jgi:hypothetical protein